MLLFGRGCTPDKLTAGVQPQRNGNVKFIVENHLNPKDLISLMPCDKVENEPCSITDKLSED